MEWTVKYNHIYHKISDMPRKMASNNISDNIS